MTTILPFLFLAICPIAMIFMMRGMHKHGAEANDPKNQQAAGASLSIAQLHGLRDDLETRMRDLDDRIYDLETTRPTTGLTSAVRSE